MYMPKFIIFILLHISLCSAESILDRIGWRGASLPVILIIISIFLIVSIFLILYYLREHVSQQKASQEHLDNLFNEGIKRLDLTKLESVKLKQIMRHEKIAEPQIIFQSVSTYEKCVDKEVKHILSRRPTAEFVNEENQVLSRLRRKLGFHHLALEHPIASSRNVIIGQSGAIFGKNLKKPLIRKATVVETNEFKFGIQYDVDKEDVINLSPGEEIKFAFTRQSDSAYGLVLHVLKADGSGTIEVGHTLNFRRNQLRQFIRMELSLPVKFRLISTADEKKSYIRRGEVVEARMADISGGGMSFIADRSLHVGDLITLNFKLPNMNFSGISSKIKRISLQEGKSKTLFKHHVEYVNIESRKRDSIVKYIFEKQRQLNQWR